MIRGEAGRRGPRPMGEFSGQTEVVSLRMTQGCKDAVQASAQRSGRSLKQEIEHLIWLGLEADQSPTDLATLAERLRHLADEISRKVLA